MQVILYIVIFALILILIKRSKKQHLVIHHVPIVNQSDQPKVVGYRKRLSVMDKKEAALFFELKKQFSDKYYIFPKMRIADVVDTNHGQGFYNRRNKVLPRHLDFVICNLSFVPMLVIELNGGYHNRPDVAERDKQKKQILEEAKLPLFTINVGDDFSLAVAEAGTKFLV